MTPSRSPFAGLERLGPGDPLSSDGYAFTGQNIDTLDRLTDLGAVTHKHDAHTAMADPTTAPTVALATTGGAIPSSTGIHVVYTLTDGAGGETLPVAATIVTTADGYSTPGAPTAAASYSAGSLLAQTYQYGITVTDGAGGETALGDVTTLTVNPGHANAEAGISGLTALTNTSSGSSTSAMWRLWRSVDGGSTWSLMSTGLYSTDTYTDDGSSGGDCTVSPPTTGTTVGTNKLKVTVPSSGQPAGATFFSIYADTTGQFLSPCLLATLPVSDYDAEQDFTSLALLNGQPPAVSQSYPGANQIDPFTDIGQAGATNGQILVWNTSMARWEPQSAGSGDMVGSNNLSDVSDAGSSRLNLHVPELSPAAVVGTANVSSLSTLATIDTYTLTAGDLVLLTAQTTAHQNGLWTAGTATWTRPTEMASGGVIKARTCAVINGSANAETFWLLKTNTSITIDTTSQTWAQIGSSGGGGGGAVSSVFTRTGAVVATGGDYTAAQVTNAADTSSSSTQAFTGKASATALIATGLTGATAASRYVGATSSSSPASGTFVTGDFIVDQTGLVWICTSGGSPGTWTASNGSPRTVSSISFSSTVTPSLPVNDAVYNIGQLTGAITIANPSGTPADGQTIRFRLSQDSTGGRVITWGSAYLFGTDVTTSLVPTGANSNWEMLFVYHSGSSKWRALAIARGF